MLAFVHIEKTAGSSVHKMMASWFGTAYKTLERNRPTDDYFSGRDLRELVSLHPNLEAIGGHWIKPYGDLDEATRELRWWTLLRDPAERCAAHYQFQVQHMDVTVSFEQWLAQSFFHNFQTRKIVNCENADLAIETLENRFLFVGLTERFKESLLMLSQFAGLGLIPTGFSRENVSADNSLKNRLLGDPQTRQLIEDANRADQRLYDYVKKFVFPRQCREYGPQLNSELERIHTYDAQFQQSRV